MSTQAFLTGAAGALPSRTVAVLEAIKHAILTGELKPGQSLVETDLAEVLRRFGSIQVRASGTVGGSIANASPIGDLAPMLIALGGGIELRHGDNVRRLPLEDFFLDYGKQDRAKGEFVCRLWFQDAAPCSVSPLMTRATTEVSTPLMRKFWPLVL